MAVVLPLIAAAGGLIQSGIAAHNANKDQQQSDAVFAQRKPYKTPSEIMDIYGMSQNNAQSGFDPTTMDYLTNQAQGSLASTLTTAKQLGADPNDFSSILNQNFKNIFQIGSESNIVKMQKFDKLINATQLLAQSKDAEWASQDNLSKDRLQTLAQRTQAQRASEQGGLNLALNGLSSLATNSLYKTTNSSINPIQAYNNKYGAFDNTPTTYASIDNPVAANVTAPDPIYRNPITG